MDAEDIQYNKNRKIEFTRNVQKRRRERQEPKGSHNLETRLDPFDFVWGIAVSMAKDEVDPRLLVHLKPGIVLHAIKRVVYLLSNTTAQKRGK
jgi:hypothetical protein